ncbi:uncharacterized protein LOC116661730 isoform X2 [Camelus ferus]|uniref:Uncharacterized protein LOC116661730 isoform X2 n=1 Tax=Camelus ferus TaxID=419612 RepID=A0A8B8SIT3_CAMFR|nr:uncharacterized protein LOC116661730 isoform X2 [Camelus ferus]
MCHVLGPSGCSAPEEDCLRHMEAEDAYCPLGTQVGLGVCCLYSRWARVALGIPVSEFLQYTRCISEPVLGDLREITLVAQASDREHVPSCSQPQTSTDASYTGKDPGLGGTLAAGDSPDVGLQPGAASAALEAGRQSPGELAPERRRRRLQGEGVRSRELLHFFSPPRPGLGATLAAGDSPDVGLQVTF